MATFEEALFKLWPNGDRRIPGLRAAMVTSAPYIFEKYGINTKTAMLQFMAQISHECGAGLEVEENLNYTAQRMMQVWPSRFHSLAEAEPYAHNPQALANKVYNGRMGNAIDSNDGWNYRGRGATQCTGREGYQKLGQKLGIDLLSHPELVNAPQSFLECGAGDFILCGCLLPALSGDLYKVTLKLNGGTVGLAERQHWFNLWEGLNVALPVVAMASNVIPDVVQNDTEPPPRLGIWASIKGLFNREG
jgi:putative chitinase